VAGGANATISDQVWDQLDPHAARLSGRDRHRVWAAVAVTTTNAVVVTTLWWIGAITPRMSATGGYLGTAPGPEPTFAFTLSLRNDTDVTANLRSVGRSGPGLRLIDVKAPSELAARTSALITLHYRVTDCSAVPTTSWPIPVRLDRLWGQDTAWVAGSLLLPDAEADTDDPSLWNIPWQQEMAQMACSGETSRTSGPVGPSAN
jgi:hypothetical protein